LDEAFFVEQPVRRQKHLAMYMMDVRIAVAERHVHRAVVEFVVPDLVKPDHDVERPDRLHRRAKRSIQISSESPRCNGIVANSPFEEVAGQRALGQRQYHWPRFEAVDLRKNRPESLEIPAVVPLSGLELREGQMDERSH